MDTALRTPKSGYLYRRLANALQDLKVEYDRTVVASIREFLAANFNNTDVFEYKLPHWYAIPWFKEKLKERKLDFVYLDTCCALTASMTCSPASMPAVRADRSSTDTVAVSMINSPPAGIASRALTARLSKM